MATLTLASLLTPRYQLRCNSNWLMMNQENRANLRRKALKGAKVIFNNRGSVATCTIRNMSEAGALLLFGYIPALPDEFELRLDDGAVHQCRKAWQDELAVGVEFKRSEGRSAPVVEVRLGGVPVVICVDGKLQIDSLMDEQRSIIIGALAQAISILVRDRE